MKMTLEDLIHILKNRLASRRNYAAQDPLKDPFYKGLQKGAYSEIDFLEKVIKEYEDGLGKN